MCEWDSWKEIRSEIQKKKKNLIASIFVFINAFTKGMNQVSPVILTSCEINKGFCYWH